MSDFINETNSKKKNPLYGKKYNRTEEIELNKEIRALITFL